MNPTRKNPWCALSLWDRVLSTSQRSKGLAVALLHWRETVRAAWTAGRQVSRAEVSAACLPFAAAIAMNEVRDPTCAKDKRARLAGGLLRDAADHLTATDQTLCMAIIATGSSGALPSDEVAGLPQRSREGQAR